jgi:hypothetical protein
LSSPVLLATPALAQTTEGNTDRPGPNYRSFEIVPRTGSIAGDGVADRCRETCERESVCLAWTAVRPGIQSKNGVCWLKKGAPAKIADSCCTSGTSSRYKPILSTGKRPSGSSNTLVINDSTSDPVPAGEQTVMLNEHNRLRGLHCTPALRWSKKLADDAAVSANRCLMAHNRKELEAQDENENLHGGSGGADYTSAQASVNSWYREDKNYSFSSPNLVFADGENNNPNAKMNGHFTQLLWKATSHVGCASKLCGEKTIWSCRYWRPGNFNAHLPETSGAVALASLKANVLPKCK